MIKGVNRQVVEVNDVGNEFFEKAILFVKPEYYGLGEGKLHERAQAIIKRAGNPPVTKSTAGAKGERAWIKYTAFCVLGAAMSAVIFSLISILR